MSEKDGNKVSLLPAGSGKSVWVNFSEEEKAPHLLFGASDSQTKRDKAAIVESSLQGKFINLRDESMVVNPFKIIEEE